MSLSYHFKPLPELGWAVLIAVATVLLPALVALDPEKIADWRTWAVALAVAVIRAAAGAALDYLRRGTSNEPETMTPEPVAGPFAVMHRQCGGAAFLTLTSPERGAVMQSADALHLNGSHTVAGIKVTCDSCGAELGAPQYADGYWIADSSGVAA